MEENEKVEPLEYNDYYLEGLSEFVGHDVVENGVDTGPDVVENARDVENDLVEKTQDWGGG